jgi:Spy/CpxP family protein refolding chaperone
MKTKTIITSALAIVMSVAVMAQKPTKEEMAAKREKIEAAKVGFITQELNLTTEEAQKFWPIYNKYKEERHNLMGDRHKEDEDRKKIDDMSDSEIEAMLNDRMDKKAKILELDKKYLAEFKKVLPIKKVAKLYKAEHKFKREMLQKFKQHKQGGPSGPQPPKGTKAPKTN